MDFSNLANYLQPIARALANSGYPYSDYVDRQDGTFSVRGFAVQGVDGDVHVFYIDSDPMRAARALTRIERILKNDFGKDYTITPHCRCTAGLKGLSYAHIHMTLNK